MLARLDDCLAAALPNAAARFGVGPGADPYRGLFVGDDLVERLVPLPLARASLGEPDAHPWAPLGTAVTGAVPLDEFETAVVVLALGPEVDLKYERIYAYLQDDIGARRPRVALALDLFCPDLAGRLAARDRFAPDAPLLREGLLELDGGPEVPLLARELRLDPQVVRQLLGGSGPDERLLRQADLLTPSDRTVPLAAALRARLEMLLSGPPQRLHLLLRGDDQQALSDLAHEIASRLELPLLRIAAEADVAPSLLVREGEAGYAVQLVGTPPSRTWDRLAAVPVVIITAGQDLGGVTGFTTLDIDRPTGIERRRWWAAAAPELTAADLDRLAARYRLAGSEIAAAASVARADGDRKPDFEALCEAARGQVRGRLAGLATRVPVFSRWDDLVLPDDAVTSLRALCDRFVHRVTVFDRWGMGRRTNGRHGVNALFAGPSGTGKTMAAQVVAGELGLDLFTIDLAGVVSKYIGETEKNLETIFAAATDMDVVLFFDEADAVFGKRSTVRDSHDRYANLEISYLLQRMEAHDGVAILATNLRQNLDEAFLRRLAFTIRFPFPEEAERLLIWQRIFPPETPLGDLDLPFLAAMYKLAGGGIRNVAVESAFLAAARGGVIEMEDVMAALEHEFTKLGGGVGRVRGTDPRQTLLGGVTPEPVR